MNEMYDNPDTPLLNDKALVVLLLLLPLFVLTFLVSEKPVGLGLHFANDFPEHRIWWMQTKTFFAEKGIVALWNPFDDFGVMHFGWRGFSSLYPGDWWLYIPYLSGGRWNYYAQYINIVLHMAVGLCGVYWILRKICRVSVLPAVIGASLFLFNHRFIDSVRYPSTIEAIAWCPWIIYAFLKILENESTDGSRKERSMAVKWFSLALFVQLSWLAGYGHYTYITLLFCGICALSQISRFKQVVIACSAVGVGSFLSAGTLLPTALQAQESATRGGGNIKFASSNPIESYVANFLHPFAADVHSSSFFPIVYLVLIILGVMVCVRYAGRFRHVFGIIIGAVILGDLALGKDGVLFNFFYNYVPFYHSFRIQGRNNWITVIALTSLCGIGAEWVCRSSKGVKNGVLLGTLVICLLSFLVTLLYFSPADFGTGGEFSPLAMGWVTREESKFLPLLLNLSFAAAVILLMFHVKSFVGRVLLGTIMCLCFVHLYAQYTTWYNEDMNRIALMKPSEYFQKGLLVPYDKGSVNRLQKPTIIADYAQIKRFETYRKYVKSTNASIHSRFTFIDSDTGEVPESLDLQLQSFGVNHIAFTVNVPKSGDLVFFSSYSPFWKCNIPFHRGEGEFDHFTVFALSLGTHHITMDFRPIILIAALLVSILGFFTLITLLHWRLGGRAWPIAYVVAGLLLCGFALAGIYGGHQFTQDELFGGVVQESKQLGDSLDVMPIFNV